LELFNYAFRLKVLNPIMIANIVLPQFYWKICFNFELSRNSGGCYRFIATERPGMFLPKQPAQSGSRLSQAGSRQWK